MSPETVAVLIGALTPFVVFGATELVKWLLPKIQGLGIITIIVPALALAVTAVSNIATSETPAWYVQIGLGLLAVFVSQLYIQFKKAQPTQ